MKSIAIKLAGGALAVLAVAGIGLAVVQPTFAQDPTPTTPQEPCGGEKGLLADYAYIMEEAIADALGVSVEELQAAKGDKEAFQALVENSGVDIETLQAVREAAREEMISQALADGVITEEQAQILREHEGRPGGHGGPRGGVAGGLLEDYAHIMDEAIADALGVSVEELQAAKEDGTARQLVEDSGVDMETLQAARDAAREEMISQALADGVITEEQAQMLREHQGRPGGHGGPRGGGRPGGVPPTDNPGA